MKDCPLGHRNTPEAAAATLIDLDSGEPISSYTPDDIDEKYNWLRGATG